MAPTLQDGDTVLVELCNTAPNPPGIFVLHDGVGLVANRLEQIPGSDPARVRIISDNTHYSPYEGRRGQHRRQDALVRAGGVRATER